MVKIWKISDNGQVTVATDCTNEDDFQRVLSDAIISYVQEAYPPTCSKDGHVLWATDLDHDMPQIISGAFSIWCKLRGYKADEVGEQRLLYSGHCMPPVEENKPFIECR